ncbi:MAG: cytochrome c oxidase subunit 3 [Bacteroidia bacterium]|nr:cytochrome c oxidase subunit 3 [Bacteroidia bacterium]
MAQHAQVQTTPKNGIWGGGYEPLGANFGKLMMWFFILSDAFTFSALLISYGALRFTHSADWPNPEKVFHAFPGIEGHAPLVFVGLMTFILIVSSVTMVLAVEAGQEEKNREKCAWYMLLTILGGLTFLGCQAWEWSHLIHGGITLHQNVEGNVLFGQLFFLITGFHGFHVTTGVILNIIVLVLVLDGYMDKIGHYDLVEKVGLYWHFVDLVWVFVFTFFYLV